MNEGKSETAYSGWQLLKDVLEAGKAQQAQTIEAAKECDHTGFYRVIGGNCIALRWCTNCGKSWRMPTQGDYIFGDHPVAEWEPIREGLEVEPTVLPDYEG